MIDLKIINYIVN